jgi:hypothetical protein
MQGNAADPSLGQFRVINSTNSSSFATSMESIIAVARDQAPLRAIILQFLLWLCVERGGEE